MEMTDLYYKVNEKEAKIVKHIYNLYARGYYSDEITVIFNEGDIVYGIYRRMIGLFGIIENIIYGIPNKKERENLAIIYEIVYDIDYINILKTRDKDKMENTVIKNLDNCVTKIKPIKEAEPQLQIIMEYYNFLTKEIRKLYKEPLEIIEEKPENRKNGALLGYDIVV